MPKFKKPSGFKMKGYSYPGKSPVKYERDPNEFAQRVRPGFKPDEQGPIEDPNLDDIEGLTDAQKGEISNAIKEGADKYTKGAQKRQQEALARMNFRSQRSKFSGGDIPDVYSPAGMPS